MILSIFKSVPACNASPLTMWTNTLLSEPALASELALYEQRACEPDDTESVSASVELSNNKVICVSENAL